MVSVVMSSASGGAAANVAEEFCTIEIKNRLLVEWHYMCSRGSTYIQLLNESLHPNPIRVSAAAARVEGRLRRRAAEVMSKSKGLSRRKEHFLDATSRCTLGREEVVDPHDLQLQLDHTSASLDSTR